MLPFLKNASKKLNILKLKFLKIFTIIFLFEKGVVTTIYILFPLGIFDVVINLS